MAVNLTLPEILRLDLPARVAVVGAGGKTSTLWRLAGSLPGRVVITTTTHLGLDQVPEEPSRIFLQNGAELEHLQWPAGSKICSVTRGPIDGHRLGGLQPGEADRLYELAGRTATSVLVEADGARSLPLKAPGPHEPVIPSLTRQVVVVAGLAGLGSAMDGSVVFRPQEFSTLSGIPLGSGITPQGLARFLCHPQGGLKGILPGMEPVLVLNQYDQARETGSVMRIAIDCLDAYPRVIIASLDRQRDEMEVHARVEQAAGIILAAGGGSRLGNASKANLSLGGETLLARAVRTAREGGLSPLIVVLGSRAEEVRRLDHPGVEWVVNRDWAAGQSGSIRAGLDQLGPRSGSAVFLLVDQPFASRELIERMVNEHRTGLYPVVAPLVGGNRSNPVLFDRVTFQVLGQIQGDTGGRAVMGSYPPHYVPWLDERLVMDIDTPEDLERCQHVL